MTEPLTLKVELNSDLRRLRLKLVEEDSPASKFRAVHQAICNGFSLGQLDPPLVLKYKDEDGDACTLVEATIEDFLSQPRDKPLRLDATRLAAPPVVAAVVASREAQAPQHDVEPRPCPVADNCAAPVVAPCVAASPPSGACSEVTGPPSHPSASSSSRSAGFDGHSVGPGKLLMCLRALRDAGMMSSKMVGSMMLQFLPILAQRAHRKQEKLNRLGPQKREELLSLLRSVSSQLGLVKETEPAKPLLEAFIDGTDVSRLGDFVALLFKALSTSKDRDAVAKAITGVTPELLESLPQLFPDLFEKQASRDGPGIAEHRGIRCVGCSREPILGPRFHCAEACIDLCGECFIVQGCEVSDQQFQCLFEQVRSEEAPDISRQSSDATAESWSWRDDAKAWRENTAWKDCWKKAWREQKAEWKKDVAKKKWEFFKGKGKGKCKGKGSWWCHEEPSARADEASDPVSATIASAAAHFGEAVRLAEAAASATTPAGDSAPPGLEAASHSYWGSPWWHWKGKGGGKDGGKDWSPPCPWWEGAAMPPAYHTPYWHCGWDSWDIPPGQQDNASFDSAAISVSSEGKPDPDPIQKADQRGDRCES